MELIIPDLSKIHTTKKAGPSFMRLAKNTGRISFSQSAVELIGLTENIQINVGKEMHGDSWFIFKTDKGGIKVNLQTKGKSQKPIFTVINSALGRVLRKVFEIQDNGSANIEIQKGIEDTDGIFYRLAILKKMPN